jgi:hypothetical protein
VEVQGRLDLKARGKGNSPQQSVKRTEKLNYILKPMEESRSHESKNTGNPIFRTAVDSMKWPFWACKINEEKDNPNTGQ